jgi:uncharacterized protein YdaU (DUF1376 family)
MNYYQRHIGDYHKKAGRLSMLEHGAYTLLLDSCYDREKFPTKEEAMDWCWAKNAEEVAAVEFVLSKFFTLEGGVYIQNTIKENIEHYHEKARKNKQIAIEREEARRLKREQAVHDQARNVHETPPNHKPITNNQEPITNIKEDNNTVDSDESQKENFLAELFEKFWKNYSCEKTAKVKKQDAKKAFMRLMRGKSEKNAEMITYAMLTHYHDNLVGVVFGADRMHPATYINKRQWEDDPEFMEQFEKQWEKDNEQPV